ncbi:MAG: YfiR family protein [Magnetococcales bacterium]|nr:YfiR family protein [Magnetococcales bacterium]
MSRFSHAWAVATMLLVVSWGANATQNDPPDEYQVKGAYLYHFTKFVTWPPSVFADQEEPFRLCVLGQNPFGSLLDLLSRKSVNNRRITILYLEGGQQATRCHLLFIANSERDRLTTILAAIQGKPVMTVGDMPDFARQGGMIHFIQVHDTLRFAINQETVLEAGLKVNAMLLQVGQVIK